MRVADLYFLWTDSEFNYKPWRTRLAAKLQVGCGPGQRVGAPIGHAEAAAVQADRYARNHFDVDRYQMLQQDARRLERLLRKID